MSRKLAFLAVGVSLVTSFYITPETLSRSTVHIHMSSVDMFGGEAVAKTKTAVEDSSSIADSPNAAVSRFKDEAAKLRREAAEMEISLREEARSRGLPEEMVNRLIPLRSETPAAKKAVKVVEKEKFTASKLRSKLGYLTIGDAVRMTADLDRYKAKDLLSFWNSKSLDGTGFSVSNSDLRSKTSIDPIKLKLDDVGYNYQNVFIVALGLGTFLGLSASQVGGELGFILGYASALMPIALVGLGSIAPALIGDVLLRFSIATNAETKERYIKWQAAKFVVGYILGLPISRFNVGGASNTAEFFQIRPKGSEETKEERQMFARNKFKQTDIARASVVCLAGAVAECMAFGEASGSNAADVNLMYELMNAVDPPLQSERVQDHIRWAAVTSYEILSQNEGMYKKAVEAFRNGLALEECIAAIEATAEEEAPVAASVTTSSS